MSNQSPGLIVFEPVGFPAQDCSADAQSRKAFFRVNRGVIINLNYLKNYSYWENNKYILRLNNGKEFTSSRERIKNLKSK
ncbi:MAG: LytTR family transcriptional regulator [Cyclobacteriaceae bacterium]|nr:LytTR family transcriptional regulator [Cyclobacteriaceae bacterium]